VGGCDLINQLLAAPCQNLWLMFAHGLPKEIMNSTRSMCIVRSIQHNAKTLASTEKPAFIMVPALGQI
jgi:hypothetical protein